MAALETVNFFSILRYRFSGDGEKIMGVCALCVCVHIAVECFMIWLAFTRAHRIMCVRIFLQG